MQMTSAAIGTNTNSTMPNVYSESVRALDIKLLSVEYIYVQWCAFSDKFEMLLTLCNSNVTYKMGT